MTLSSLLKTTNMKHLLKALISTNQTSPSPFYLLKIAKANPISCYPDFLFLNRSLSNAAVQGNSKKFSVWSPQHLQRLRNCGLNSLENRAVLMNPFKSDELIQQALHFSINGMVITSVQEYEKIQKIKYSYNQYRNRALNYYWAYSDQPTEIENMSPLKNVITNLVFDWEELRSGSKIDAITRNILQLGYGIESVICSGNQGDSSQLKRWSLQHLSHSSRTIKKQIEIKDVSDVQQYVLAAKSKGRGPKGIDTMVQQLIQFKDYAKNCLMINVENEEWLFSRISKFPLDEEPYLYELEVIPENKPFEIEQASVV